MFKNSVAVLDIGSSYISLFVGEESVNGTFAFRAKEVEEKSRPRFRKISGWPWA